MKRILTIFTAFVVLAGFSTISYTEGEKNEITLEEAIAIAIKNMPGSVIKAELEKGYYEIKIKTSDGSVEKVYVDAIDGSILERHRKSSDRDKEKDKKKYYKR